MADRETIIETDGGDGGAAGIVLAAIIVALLFAGGFVLFSHNVNSRSVTLDIPKVTVTAPAAPTGNGQPVGQAGHRGGATAALSFLRRFETPKPETA